MFLGFMNDKYNKNFDSLPGGSTMKLVLRRIHMALLGGLS
jgi:hypothetical protein